MNGTIINVSAIILFGAFALISGKEFTEAFQLRLKKFTGFLCLALGLVMMCFGFDWGDGIVTMLIQFGIFYASALLGILIGSIMRIEKVMAKFTQKAQKMYSESKQGNLSNGFQVCTILFCVGPMAIVGAIVDGATHNYFILVIKALLDGVSVMAFARFFGYGAIISALPVGVMQGTIAMFIMAFARPHLSDLMKDSINLTGGFLVISMSLIILGARKVPIANYIPALIIAPLLTKWWLE